MSEALSAVTVMFPYLTKNVLKNEGVLESNGSVNFR